jgi:hypothetical protein
VVLTAERQRCVTRRRRMGRLRSRVIPESLSCLIDREARLSLLPAVPQVGETVDGVRNLADHEASPHAVVAIPSGRWCRCLISVKRHGGCLAFARHASVRMRQDSHTRGTRPCPRHLRTLARVAVICRFNLSGSSCVLHTMGMIRHHQVWMPAIRPAWRQARSGACQCAGAGALT